MSTDAADEWRAGMGITLTPPEIASRFPPIVAFEQLFPSLGALCPDVVSYIQDKKFKTPTAIQV